MANPTLSPDVNARAANLDLMVFDVDGVLTNGQLYYGPSGETMKAFNALDGQGIKLLQRAGVATAIISARQSAILTQRCIDLNIQHLYQGAHDKRIAFSQLLKDTGISTAKCGFIGDDVIDLPVLLQVGFAASVSNAHAEVRARVHYVTQAAGGHGAAREICDLILRARGQYDALLAPYLT